MDEYNKIQTVFLRDPENKLKTLLEGQFTLPEFEYLKNNIWIFTEKVDGMNIRVEYSQKYTSPDNLSTANIEFKGKSDNTEIPTFLLEKLKSIFSKRKQAIIDLFEDTDVCFYGEGYGAKIQKGHKYRDDQGFVLFDIKIGQWWLRREDVEDIAVKLGLDVVPVIGEGTLLEMVEMAKTGFSSTWGHFPAEGIVARPRVELFTRGGERIITKIKHRDFRMKGEINGKK